MSAHRIHTTPYGACVSIRKGSPFCDAQRCDTWFGKWRLGWVSALTGQLLLKKHKLMMSSMHSLLSTLC